MGISALTAEMCPCGNLLSAFLICIFVSRIIGQQPWSCSAADPSTNLYSLPDLPVMDHQAIVNEPTRFSISKDSSLVIYPVPPVLNCNGTISALDFCYRERNVSSFNTEAHVFTLLILNKDSSSFTVTNRIAVRSTASNNSCAIHQFSQVEVQYCCDRFSLDTQDWFDLPGPNFAFGIITETTRALVVYETRSFTNLIAQAFQHDIEGDILAVGNTITLTEQDMSALRMFNFVLGPSTTVNPVTPQPSLFTGTPSHTTISTSITSPTPSPTHSSTPYTSAEATIARSTASTSLVSPTPTNQLQQPIGITNATPDVSLGLIAGIAAGACILAVCVLVLLAFIAVTKWRSRKKSLKQNKNNNAQSHTTKLAPFDHTSNGIYGKKSIVARYDKERGEIYSDDTHNDVVMVSTNDAYGVSYPNLLGDDLYENIDSLATLCMFVPETATLQTSTASSRNVFSDPAFGDDCKHEYTDIAVVSEDNQEAHDAPCEVVTNQFYEARTQGFEYQHDLTDMKTNIGNFAGRKARTDSNHFPMVFSSNQAYGAGSKEECRHVYTDIATTSDSTSRKAVSHLPTSSNKAYGVGTSKSEYTDIGDTIDCSSQTATSYPNEAYGVQSDIATVPPNQTELQYAVIADPINSAGQTATAEVEIHSNAAVVSSNQAYGLDANDEEQYTAIADVIQSTSYRAAVAGPPSKLHVTQRSEENQYELIPADIQYDTVRPASVVVVM